MGLILGIPGPLRNRPWLTYMTRGVARLVREGLEAKARLEPEDDEKVMRLLRRLEEGQ